MVDDSIIIWIIGIRELYWDYMVVIWFLWWFYVDYTTNNTNWLMMSLRVTLQPILIVLNYHGILCSKNYGYFTVCIWVISCDFQISHHNWPIMWISRDIMGMKHQQGLTNSHRAIGWVSAKENRGSTSTWTMPSAASAVWSSVRLVVCVTLKGMLRLLIFQRKLEHLPHFKHFLSHPVILPFDILEARHGDIAVASPRCCIVPIRTPSKCTSLHRSSEMWCWPALAAGEPFAELSFAVRRTPKGWKKDQLGVSENWYPLVIRSGYIGILIVVNIRIYKMLILLY